MPWYRIISDYWSQLVVVLGAVGFIFKILAENNFKRKELWYSMWTEKKINSILLFYSTHHKVVVKVMDLTLQLHLSLLTIESATRSYLEVKEINRMLEMSQMELLIFLGPEQRRTLSTVCLNLTDLIHNVGKELESPGTLPGGFQQLYADTINLHQQSHLVLYTEKWKP